MLTVSLQGCTLVHMPKQSRYSLKREKVVEVLRHGARSAELVKVRSIFPGQSASFFLQEVGQEAVQGFNTRNAAHTEYNKNWIRAAAKPAASMATTSAVTV